MFTEREAIRLRMTQIQEEQRDLHNEYTSLFDRLRGLDQREKIHERTLEDDHAIKATNSLKENTQMKSKRAQIKAKHTVQMQPVVIKK